MNCSRHRFRCQNQMNKEFSDLNNLLTKIYPFFSSLLSPTLVPTSVKVFDFISDVSIEITKNLPTFYRFISRVILWCRTPTRDVYLADKSDTNIESRNSDFRDQTWVRHESAKWLFSDCSTNVSRVQKCINPTYSIATCRSDQTKVFLIKVQLTYCLTDLQQLKSSWKTTCK